MKSKLQNWSGRAAMLLMLATVVSGCSTVGYKTGDETSASLERASRCVARETEELNATISSLAQLVSSPAADLKPQFNVYRASRNRLVDAVGETDRAIARLRRESASYLASWNEEIAAMNYQVIRDASEARRSAVSNQVEAVCARYAEAQAVVRPFIDYFTDLERSIGTDLTLDGLASASEVVRRAEENTRKVQAALEQLSTELAVCSAKLSTVTRETPIVSTRVDFDGKPQAKAASNVQ